MLIVTSKPCGCSPFSDKHHCPTCPIVREDIINNEDYKKALRNFTTQLKASIRKHFV